MKKQVPGYGGLQWHNITENFHEYLFSYTCKNSNVVM